MSEQDQTDEHQGRGGAFVVVDGKRVPDPSAVSTAPIDSITPKAEKKPKAPIKQQTE